MNSTRPTIQLHESKVNKELISRLHTLKVWVGRSVLSTYESDFCLSQERLSLCANYKVAGLDNQVIHPEIQIGGLLLELQAPIHLNVFVYGRLSEVKRPILSRGNNQVFTGQRDSTGAPRAGLAPFSVNRCDLQRLAPRAFSHIINCLNPIHDLLSRVEIWLYFMNIGDASWVFT